MLTDNTHWWPNSLVDYGMVDSRQFDQGGVHTTTTTSDEPAAQRGWICPRCETVHAPIVLSCTCAVSTITWIRGGVQRTTITYHEGE